MAGAFLKHENGPLTFHASKPINGGQLVAPDGNTGKIEPAGASTVTVLGVALTDARPYNEDEVYGTTAYGAHVMDASVPQDDVAVAYQGVIELPTTGSLTFGQLVQPAANGAVAPHSSGVVVGRCVTADGVPSGGRAAVLLMLLGSATITTESGTGD